MENKFSFGFTASTGQVCFKLLESVTYEEYEYHKGQVISSQTLAMLMNTSAEVNVVCCCIQ